MIRQELSDASASLYSDCRLCPNLCGVDRTDGESGLCGESAEMRIAFAGIHRGEEPPISVVDGSFRGSGTIFFTGCTLGCYSCQNIQLSCASGKRLGTVVSIGEFASICLALQEAGAANINLVTGTHVIPSIRDGILLAREDGLVLPVVWNTSSFESVVGLEYIDPVVDVYLPDLKTLDPGVSMLTCGKSGYAQAAAEAIRFMMASKPLQWDGERLTGGVIMRHLVLPGYIDNTAAVLEWYSNHGKHDALLSLMVQFIAMDTDGSIEGSVTQREYDYILSLIDEFGIEDGFIQDLGDDEPWIPDFNDRNPFPQGFCDPVWHWRYGFIRDEVSGT